MKREFLLAMLAASCAWAQGGFSGPGRYEISNVQSRRCLDLDRNDRRTVIQFESRGTDNQTWQVEDAGGGFYFIRNAMNGFALEALNDRNSTPVEGNLFHGGQSQLWRIQPSRGGGAQILNSNGKSLDIPDGSNRNGIRVQTYDRNDDPNQAFAFRRVGGGMGRWNDAVRRQERDRVPPPVVVEVPRGGGDKYFDNRDRMWKLRVDGACFYAERDYNGNALCVRSGEERTALGREIGSFGSVKFFGRVRSVHVFERERFGGRRLELRADEPDLVRAGGRRVVSIRVF